MTYYYKCIHIKKSAFKDDVRNGRAHIPCLQNEHFVKTANLFKLLYGFSKFKIGIKKKKCDVQPMMEERRHSTTSSQ